MVERDAKTQNPNESARRHTQSKKSRRRPTLSERARRFGRALAATYATVDPRSLGLLRIGLGVLLFEDVARRYPDLVAFYTNDGWLTNHFAMFRPMSSHLFSVYHAFSTPAEVKVLFFAHLAVNLAFLVGYRTKLMHALAFILLTSLNSRNVIIENGGFVMLNLLVLYTWFLPLGGRFSVDAWIASWRTQREESVAELNEPLPRSITPVVSLAVTAVVLQWATNYYLNTVQKSGQTWHDGSALHYFMQQGRIMRPFGFWLRDQIPFSVSSFLTRATLVIEGSIVVLWLSPYFTKPARMMAWFLSIGLHVGIALFARLGPFSWVMMLAYVMFIPPEAWEWARRRVRGARKRVVWLMDDTSGFALAVARCIRRLDVLGAVRFDVAKSEGERSRPSAALRTHSGHGPVRHDRAAVALLGQALMLPRILLRVGFVAFWAALLRRLLARRAALTRRLGLDRAVVVEPRRPSRARQAFRFGGWVLGELAIVFLLALGTTQVLLENRVVPAWAKPNERPNWMTAMIVYPRLFQGWSMFAPDPPRDDGWMIIDGRTADGRHLDPLTGKEPNFSMDLPGGPDFSPQWGAFHMRIHEPRFSPYYNGFRDYLLRHHELSEEPEDRLVAFDAWYLSRIVAPPGGKPGPTSYRKLFNYGRVTDSGLPAGATDASKPQSPAPAPPTPPRRSSPLARPNAQRPPQLSPSAGQRLASPPPSALPRPGPVPRQ